LCPHFHRPLSSIRFSGEAAQQGVEVLAVPLLRHHDRRDRAEARAGVQPRRRPVPPRLLRPPPPPHQRLVHRGHGGHAGDARARPGEDALAGAAADTAGRVAARHPHLDVRHHVLRQLPRVRRAELLLRVDGGRRRVRGQPRHGRSHRNGVPLTSLP